MGYLLKYYRVQGNVLDDKRPGVCNQSVSLGDQQSTLASSPLPTPVLSHLGSIALVGNILAST